MGVIKEVTKGLILRVTLEKQIYLRIGWLLAATDSHYPSLSEPHDNINTNGSNIARFTRHRALGPLVQVAKCILVLSEPQQQWRESRQAIGPCGFCVWYGGREGLLYA